MTDDTVARARAALEGVTPEPWEVYDDEPDLLDGYQIWHDDGDPGIAFVCRGIHQGHDDGRADARFIAASRTLLPELLAEVEKWQFRCGQAICNGELREAERDAARHELALLRDVHAEMAEERTAARAEVERLRGALEWIASHVHSMGQLDQTIKAVLRGDQ